MQINYNVLNQKGTPAIYESSLATIPAAGYIGRIFIDSDTPSTGIYRDNGTTWDLIAQTSAGGAFVVNGQDTPDIYAQSFIAGPPLGTLGTLWIDTDIPSTGIYRYDGFSWVQISTNAGAGGTPTLQQVTTAGATTNVNVEFTGNRGIYVNNSARLYRFGEVGSLNNATFFEVIDTSRTISTFSGGFAKGFNLDFNSDTYSFGNLTLGNFLNLDYSNIGIQNGASYNHFYMYDLSGSFPNYKLGNFQDSQSRFLHILDNGTIIGIFDNNISDFRGLKLNYNLSQFNFGWLNGNGVYTDLFYTLLGDTSLTNASIKISQGAIATTFDNLEYGLKVDYYAQQYKFGDFSGGTNNPYLQVYNNALNTYLGATQKGLSIDFNNTLNCTLGDITQGTFINTSYDIFNNIGYATISANNGTSYVQVFLDSDAGNLQLSSTSDITINSVVTLLNSTNAIYFSNTAPLPRYNYLNVANFPNNGAALAAGLQIGDIYRQGATAHFVI